MNTIGVFKNEDNILLNESFDGFLKIFINLSIAAVATKLAFVALSDGNQITAICYGVVASILLILSIGYLAINIVGKSTKCLELKVSKLVGDSDTVTEAEKKLFVNQVALGAFAFLVTASLYVVISWSLAGIIITMFS